MAKKKEIEEIKPVGPVIHAPVTLHGRRVKLTRGGKEVDGVLLAKDGQASNEDLVFQWTNEHGTASISPLSGEERELLLGG